MEKIVSKKQAIKETRWLRRKLNEWKSKRQGNHYHIDSLEKEKFIDTLEQVESFVGGVN